MWGYHDTCGGYHEYRGGYQFLLFEYLHSKKHPTVLMISPYMYHDVPHGIQITKDDVPYGTDDMSHMYHDILHATERPPQCLRYPAGYS